MWLAPLLLFWRYMKQASRGDTAIALSVWKTLKPK